MLTTGSILKRVLVGFFSFSLVSSYSLNANTNMLNLSVTLRAISQIESGDDDNAIGKQGERSRFQIMRHTWEQYTTIDFLNGSKHYPISEPVARCHVSNTIHKILVSNPEHLIAPHDIYIIWNQGFTFYQIREFRFENIRKDHKIIARVNRFDAIYNKFLKEELQLKLWPLRETPK